MRKLISIFAALMLIISCACADESLTDYPAQSGLDAAMAVNAMHAAVMRDVIGSGYTFSELAGGDSIFVLFTDAEAMNYLMISLTDEDKPRADMAVIQCYTLKEFETNGLDSMTAVALPFIPEENLGTFEKWREDTRMTVADAFRGGKDIELTYYTGEYVTCAMSLMNNGGGDALFTVIVSWNTPLTAENITSLMEAPADAE